MVKFLTLAIRERLMTRAQAAETLELQDRMKRMGFRPQVGQIAVTRAFLRDDAEASELKRKLDAANAPSEKSDDRDFADPRNIKGFTKERTPLQLVCGQVAQFTVVSAAYLVLRYSAEWSAAALIPAVTLMNGLLGLLIPFATTHLRSRTRFLLSAATGLWIALAITVLLADPTNSSGLMWGVRIAFIALSAAGAGLAVWRGIVNRKWTSWNAAGQQLRLHRFRSGVVPVEKQVLSWTLSRMRLHPTRFMLSWVGRLLLKPRNAVTLWLFEQSGDRILARAVAGAGTTDDIAVLDLLLEYINESPVACRPYDAKRFDEAVLQKMSELNDSVESDRRLRHLSKARRAALKVTDRFQYVSTAGYVISENRSIDALVASLCPTWNDEPLRCYMREHPPTASQKTLLTVKAFSYVPVRFPTGRVMALAAWSNEENGVYLEDRTALLEAAERLVALMPPPAPPPPNALEVQVEQ